MSMQQEPDYELRVIADLEFAEMAYVQGNNRMTQLVYRHALSDLLHLKGKIEPEKFEMYKQTAVSGLEQVHYSILMKNARVGFFTAKKLLENTGNHHVKKYNKKMRRIFEQAKILDDVMPLHDIPC